MGKRRENHILRQVEMAESRSYNGPLKVKERARRDARIKAALKAGKLPYTRYLRNWLCVMLDKKESQLTQADVDGIVKG